MDERLLEHDLLATDAARIKATAVFEIARREDWPDEANALVAWLGRMSRQPDKRTYEALRELAALDDLTREPSARSRHARGLMAALGVMRAIRAAMLEGGAHVGT